MIGEDRVLAVIPARGGSKRCPRKNVRPFRGRPLLLWTLDAARACSLIDTIVVSTDDAGIKGLCDGLCTVLHRPAELATDTATNEDVLRHAVTEFPHDIIVLLQPTSPLRTSKDIETPVRWMHPFSAVCSYDFKTEKKNGAVYVVTRDLLMRSDFSWSLYYADPYWMPHDRSLDIDYPEQFE